MSVDKVFSSRYSH